MCCLFGFIDYKNTLTAKEKSLVTHALATASEARGTDAAGIAYCSKGHMHIYKRPLTGHRLPFRIPQDTRVVMGHTRLSTQGSAKKNFNNHPFQSRAGGQSFALAHNGVISNDLALRREFHLPKTNIQTDSYVAVQLLEQGGAITGRVLGNMAEKLEGSFSFTILDSHDSIYFIRGNNPLCIRSYPKMGLCLYASTVEILDEAIKNIPLFLGKGESVDISCGDILKLDVKGNQSRCRFDDSRLWLGTSWGHSYCYETPYLSWTENCAWTKRGTSKNYDHVQALKSVAGSFGLSPCDIDELLSDGFTVEEIEDSFYGEEL